MDSPMGSDRGAVNGLPKGVLVRAAGGGIAANVAWHPGTVGLGMGVQAANPANRMPVNNWPPTNNVPRSGE